jgi:hypothetical protein
VSSAFENSFRLAKNSWGATPLLVGGLLLFAALLKSWDGLIDPAATRPLLSAVFRAAVILVELGLSAACFGFLPLGGLRTLLILIFTSFAGYAVYMSMTGADSCGCFGPVKLHPAWTVLLDIGVLGFLLFRWPTPENSGGSSSLLDQWRRWAIAFLAMVIPAVALLLARQPQVIASGEVLADAGGLVILEPESWIGRTLPILEEINIGPQVAQGEWVVLLYHHDCPKCQEALPLYLDRAKQWDAEERQAHVAVIETPPFAANGSQGFDSVPLQGRLSDEREWFVQTPVEITLEDGVVTHVRDTFD